MAGCSYCGEMHAPLWICDARRKAAAVHKPVNSADVNTPVNKDEKRKAYMRDYMRKKRGKG